MFSFILSILSSNTFCSIRVLIIHEMIRAVRHLWHSKRVLSGILKSVKPVLGGHLRELESRELTLRSQPHQCVLFKKHPFSSQRIRSKIGSTTQTFFCFHLSTLTRFHSKTHFFDMFSLIVHFKTPDNADHQLVQNFAIIKINMINYVRSKIATSHFEN